ncbi:MAG: signal peptidase II [Phycisphaerae bacterium]
MSPADEKRRCDATKPTSGKTDQNAIKSRSAVVVFALVTVLGLAGDLFSKWAVFDALLDDPSIPQRIESISRRYGDGLRPEQVLHQLSLQHDVGAGIKLTLSTNPGVVFGLPMPRWLVATATIVTVSLVVSFFATSDAKVRSMHVALGCILAGALGNLYDRLLAVVELPGAENIRYQVRDFIDFSAWHYPWVFNVADILLVVGVAIMALHWLVTVIRERSETAG